MSDAGISDAHRDLAALEGEAARQQRQGKEIQKRAREKLKEINDRLSEIHGSTDPDEYQSLLEERGQLEQVLEPPPS